MSQQPTAQQVPNDASVPKGWKEYTDPKSGRTYYANKKSGETTWERPKEVPDETIRLSGDDSATASDSQENAQKEQQEPVSLAPKEVKQKCQTFLDSLLQEMALPDKSNPYMVRNLTTIGTCLEDLIEQRMEDEELWGETPAPAQDIIQEPTMENVVRSAPQQPKMDVMAQPEMDLMRRAYNKIAKRNKDLKAALLIARDKVRELRKERKALKRQLG